MKYFRNVVICLLMEWAIPPAVAQRQDLQFEQLSTEDGLSQSNVICILQDSRGFMWFGTRNGLDKYDGYKFTVYKNDPNDSLSLSHNSVTDIVEDADGNLWIATNGGGLNKFDRDTETFIRYQHNGLHSSSLVNNNLTSLLIDGNGNLWVGTDGSGFDLFDKKNNAFTHYENMKDRSGNPYDLHIKDIFEDSDHHIWIGTGAGLNLFDQETKSVVSFLPDKLKRGPLGYYDVLVIFEDSRSRLWIGTRGGGLNIFNRETHEFTQYKNDPSNENSLANNSVLSISEDSKGDLWVGTENGGLSILDYHSGIFHNYRQDDIDKTSVTNNSIWAIFKDAKGNMWVGTFNGGISFLNLDASKFMHYRHSGSPNSLSNNNVLAIFEDSTNDLWIGTDGGGMNKFQPATGRFTHYKHDSQNKKTIAGNHVLKIIEDSKKDLWIGTWGDGVSVFNRKTNAYKHFKNDPAIPSSLSSNNAWAIFEDSDQNVWIGTYREGLDLYDERHDNFIHYRHSASNPGSIASNTINVIYEDNRGTIWVGTGGSGLEQFDKRTQKFTHFVQGKLKGNVSSNNINCLYQDRRGHLWIGTDVGLDRMDLSNNEIISFHVPDGLPDEAIFGILEDDHQNLWISTNKGLSRFNPQTKTFKNFNVADGLQSNEFKQGCAKSRSGKMYFGGVNGFNEFFPDSIKDRKYDPPIVLSGFQIFNKPVYSIVDDHGASKNIVDAKKVVLSYTQSVISFEFATLNYGVRNDKKLYSYKLEGFDNDWNEIGTTHNATYTNLDPGSYTFKVRGLNNEGNRSANTIALAIVITPPYWATWWFRILVTLSILGAIVSLFIAKSRLDRKLKIKLVEKISISTAEITGQKETLEAQAENMQTLNDQLQAQTSFLEQINEELQVQREEAERARQESEKANQAKSTFLATMSHEIRTPMNGVLGMASLLSETSLTSEQREYTDTIIGSGEALLTVINDILDFSKIESGHLELDHHVFDLRQCIEDVMDIFSNKAAQKGLDLVYQIDYLIPAQIIGDSHRLRQVILNLIGNAMKFTTHGEIFLGIDLLKITDNQLELAFQVRDTGIGIPTDNLSRLFKPFSQVDSSTTRRYGGTGLGLVIARRLVELMGGFITVESEPGVGTSFRFTLKALVNQESIRQRVHTNLAGNEGKKVLVVDDNATNLMILKTQLEQWKLLPTLTSSGSEALRILSLEKFDLVITDMQMPDMDGIQLTQQIKIRKLTLPIILLSSIGDENKRKHPDLFYAVLSKPVKQQQFGQVLQSVLRGGAGSSVPLKNKTPTQLLSMDFAVKNPLRILVAEDNPVNQKLIERILNNLGYQNIAIVQNGMEAIEKMDDQFYDIILMDVQMPEMDGLEATRMIRLKDYRQPIIISMTANAMQGDREACLKAGMDDYISKPVKLDALISILEKWALQIREKA